VADGIDLDALDTSDPVMAALVEAVKAAEAAKGDADDHGRRYNTSEFDECEVCGFEWPCPSARLTEALAPFRAGVPDDTGETNG